jgi:hypothetical protein
VELSESKSYSCELCDKVISKEALNVHHQSYEPEIVINLCIDCHAFLHSFDRHINHVATVLGWVKEYSHNWVRGKENYKKSDQYRKLKREEYYRVKDKQWFKEYKEKRLEGFKHRRVNDPEWAEKQRERCREWRKEKDIIEEAIKLGWNYGA